MNSDKGLTTKLSDRLGPVRGAALVAAESTLPIGPLYGGAFLVEDVENIRVTIQNVGANPTVVGKAQINDFSPLEADEHWADLTPADGSLANLAVSAQGVALFQGSGHRWMRIRASSANGTSVDAAVTGR